MDNIEYIDKHIEFLKNESEISNGGYRKMLLKRLKFFENYRRGVK